MTRTWTFPRFGRGRLDPDQASGQAAPGGKACAEYSMPEKGVPLRYFAVILALASASFGSIPALAQEAVSPMALLPQVMAQAERYPASSAETMRYRAERDPMQRVARRLDRMQADLHLKPEQIPAWDALRSRIMLQAQSRLDRMRSRLGMQHSLDEAMRERADRLRQQAQMLDETAQLLKVLVDQLSPEQRTILRLHQQHQHRARHLMPPQHRRYLMGMEVSPWLEVSPWPEVSTGLEESPLTGSGG
jgi:hypothetical protein